MAGETWAMFEVGEQEAAEQKSSSKAVLYAARWCDRSES